jgi:SAM-dependent methyltransferase
MTSERASRIRSLGYAYADRQTERVVKCNLCGSGTHVEVSRRDRYGFPAVLQLCAHCGLGFLSPRMTAGEYRDFYVDIYRPLVSAYHGRLIDAESVQEDQRGYAADLTRFLENHLPSEPATVLDVGGSTGVVASAVRDAFGAAPTVLDVASDELAVAAQNGVETIDCFAEDYEPGERRWDLVLLCQTIDHLLDVASTLGSIRKLLAPERFAFVDVLDYGFVSERQGCVEGAVKIDHPFYLTRSTARGFFDLAGLHVAAERLSDDGHWGFLLTPGEPREPDWKELRRHADALLARLWRLRGRA